MKKFLSAFVLLLLCVAMLTAFVGCDTSDPKRYSIEMKNEEWLYEELPSSAAAGEAVTVRITKDRNVGMYAFMVNGDQVGEDVNSQNEKYWQFSFVMPNEDVLIEFETHQHPDSELEKECEFFAQYIRTDGYHDGVRYPIVTVIRSVPELNAYYEANKDKYSLERRTGTIYSDSTIGFLDACDKYTEEYFEDRMLLMVLLEVGSGSIRHKVERVAANEAGIAVDITTIVPEVGTDDMAEWHILIELEAGVYADDEDAITVFLNGRDTTQKEKPNEKNAFLEKAEEINKYFEDHLKTAETQYEMNTESGIIREKWDSLLSEVHKCLEKELPESDYKKLQEDDAEWIVEMEKAINDAAEEWKGGSGEPMARNMAAIRCMEERFNYLISLFDNAELLFKYKLDTSEIKNELIEELEYCYPAGDEVTVVIGTVTETNQYLWVNDEKLNPVDRDLLHTVFRFVMPDRDVKLRIEEESVDIPLAPQDVSAEPDDALTKTEIEQIALGHCKHNYDHVETTYDTDNEKWQVEFWENGGKLAAQTVTLDSDGNFLYTWFAE